MTAFSLTTLYVDDPAASATFYTALLGHPPLQVSPDFVMFGQPPGSGIGLWSRHDVKPGPEFTGGGCELTFRAPDVMPSTPIARGAGWPLRCR